MIAYLKSLLYSILQSLGLYQKQGTILFLGLDNAGKTTLLHRLRTNTLLAFSPTERPHQEQFYMQNIRFIGWDLGGHEAVRHIWGDYIGMDGVSGILFMIDASDFERLEDVREELDELINGDGGLKDICDVDDDIGDGGDNNAEKKSCIPLAILLNKCDLEEAHDSENIQEAIGFHELIADYENGINLDDSDHDYTDGEGNDPIELIRMYRTSVWRGEGYQDAFQWIATFL